MSVAQLNTFSSSDSNLLNIMSVLGKVYIGMNRVTLTNMDNTTVPAVAAGSILEVAGAIFPVLAEEPISTTDPVTAATVADGTVYIVAVPSGQSITFAFTATKPTWSDSKQGWYLATTGFENYRCVGVCLIYSGGYKGKLSVGEKREHFPFRGVFSSNNNTNLAMTASTTYTLAISNKTASNLYTYFGLPNTISLSSGNILIPESGLYQVIYNYRIGSSSYTGAYVLSVNLVCDSISRGTRDMRNISTITYSNCHLINYNGYYYAGALISLTVWCSQALKFHASYIFDYIEIIKIA